MPDLRQTRQKITTALVVMAALDVLALVVYISPLVGSTETRRQTINRLQMELTLKTKQVAPLKDLAGPHGKVQLANREIAEFYKKRIPQQDSQIPAEFGKLANENGVSIEQVKYKLAEGTLGNLQPVELDADLAGNYTALARFINALERDDMFFIINSITLGGEQQGPVKLNLKLEAFLRMKS
jgi:type IV pilus assembly protein PilO